MNTSSDTAMHDRHATQQYTLSSVACIYGIDVINPFVCLMTKDATNQRKTAYVCQKCGSVAPKWQGQCGACHEWNTLVQERVSSTPSGPSFTDQHDKFESIQQEDTDNVARLVTGNNEFDRTCGGGVVMGSISLLAGDPGIGKSTLLLQLAHHIAKHTSVLYISGEESSQQIRLRAKRLGVTHDNIQLMSTNHLDNALVEIPKALSKNTAFPGFIIIDSIQTMMLRDVGSTAGTVGQIRECIHALTTLAKATGLAVMVVGHITKEGAIAGPKILEHMVDTVLYFEGDNNRPYRLLRTMKNRFGATHEVGVFEMGTNGLKEVSNPSALFISNRETAAPGSCIFAGMEGTRPILVEFQALATSSFLPSPRRSIVGWDHHRLSMVLAVLEAKCKTSFANKDVFLTVLGGMRIHEPAADLCVALALLSCLKKRPLSAKTVAFGEIGLTGEIYNASFTEHRLREAHNLGFEHVFMPPHRGDYACPDLNITHVRHVNDLERCFE